MDKQEIETRKITLDDLAYTDEETGVEYWYARDLQKHLGYAEWRNFEVAINRAIVSAETTRTAGGDHFVEVNKMVSLGSGSEREVKDYKLTRYACYLVAQNGDPRKEQIAFAQSYFALQTRKQELIEERMNVIARIEARAALTEAERQLSANIYQRGIDNQGFGRIRSKGDAALFGGRATSTMKKILKVSDKKPLADVLPSVTVAAKSLATEMTNLNVEKEDMHGEYPITDEHVKNNQGVRELLGKRGIKPEELPPEEDIKKLERKVKSEQKRLEKDSRGFSSSEAVE
ncbi:MAG: DNA damage-inducible protein D [Coriobacteriales bacterium]|jgi:DNA-damage-inducible protein D|nr:DNA damage-inducible protein D [Coriobacteriales bacterium]